MPMNNFIYMSKGDNNTKTKLVLLKIKEQMEQKKSKM